MKQTIAELMSRTGVKFGTSGARGLVTELTDLVAYTYTAGFLNFLRARGELGHGVTQVAVGGDLRPSTDRIMTAVRRAVGDFGLLPLPCGHVPSPALALYGLERRIPAIMVTGSHIPDDRNGIKFSKPGGEILKEDESAMMAQVAEWSDALFDDAGRFVRPSADPAPASDGHEAEVKARYIARYLAAFPGRPLAGMNLAVYQHSAVGRDVIVQILTGLGAEVSAVGRSESFIPVDTEAIRAEDVALAKGWAARGGFDAIVSADGDSDRPLVSDERGEWLRGDVTGILTAEFLGAHSVVTPVSSNTALEAIGAFPDVWRTRIGSPYVVAAMLAASAAGSPRVVGYEANGGFLINSEIPLGEGRTLGALPTRDAVIVMLGVLLLARQRGLSVSGLVAGLPARFTASDRLPGFPIEQGREILEALRDAERGAASTSPLVALLVGIVGAPVEKVDRTDGVRMTFANGEIVHLRPSGNAPEFRCYAEAGRPERAAELCAEVLNRLRPH